jgi:hypothetical protein
MEDSIIAPHQESILKAEPIQTALYPGQISLNHTQRRREINRINKENLIMLRALRDVKPSVKRTDWQKHS